MLELKRRNTLWIIILSIIVAFAVLADGLLFNTVPELLLMGLWAFAVTASMFRFNQQKLELPSIRRTSFQNKITDDARNAANRARHKGGYAIPNIWMLDLGLISVQMGEDGMAMRRAQSVSKDDDGTRPFITLQVDSREADRRAMIRFEILDQQGELLFVFETNAYLREGENNIIADRQLPLADNTKIQGAGDWDLRVLVDGNLLGIHHFSLMPSLRERRERLTQYQKQAEDQSQNQPAKLGDLVNKDDY